MKIIKTRIVMALSFITTFFLAFSNSAIIARAESRPVLNENFVPFRHEIPDYLSRFSDYDSEMIKKLWEKIFFEENYNISTNPYVYWVKLYDDYYTRPDGTLQKVSEGIQNNKITWSTGDFETFFGNSLVSNPEFLGELLGLTGYNIKGTVTEKIESYNPKYNKVVPDKMAYAVSEYFMHPEKYPIFVKKLAELTADGTYIGESKDSEDNLLRKVSCYGTTYDYYVLYSLATLYKGYGEEPYLSEKQVNWIKSYQLEFYNKYLSQGDSFISILYKPQIFNLIARSTYAANNLTYEGRDFFDYVLKSKKGVGAFLSMNENINISGLEHYDDIIDVFDTANGWCCGEEDADLCGNHADCISNATEGDRIAYLLYHNEAAKKFLLNNTTTYNLIEDTGGTYGYKSRFNIKHDGEMSGKVYANTKCGKGAYKPIPLSRNYHKQGNGLAAATADGTAIFPLKDLPYLSMLNYVFVKDINTPDSGTTEEYLDRLVNWSVTINDEPIATMENPSRVQADFTDKGLRFDISDLSQTERENASINITVESYRGFEMNYPENDISYFSCVVTASISNKVYVEGDYPECIAKGHSWKASEKDGSIEWAKDYSTVTVTPCCSNGDSHKLSPTTYDTTASVDGNYTVYTAYCPALKKPLTKRVLNK